MRYYKITITDSNGNPFTLPSMSGIGQPGVITSLMPDGVGTNPAALNIEMDIAQYAGHSAGQTRSYVRIWGLGLADIGAAVKLNPANANDLSSGWYKIAVEGGMAKGYPLANPGQKGLLVTGLILQSFGNWMGTEMTLDFILTSDGGTNMGTASAPANYAFTWTKGEQLSALVSRVIGQVSSGKVTVSISQQRVAPQTYNGYYETFAQFASWVQQHTAGQLGKDDNGVNMSVLSGGDVLAYEGTPKNAPSSGTLKKIDFTDLLGQVTWYAPQQVTAKLVMRGDLDMGMTIQFPDQLISTTTAASFAGLGGSPTGKNALTFSGQKFAIMQIQHWGNFRQPDAMSWNTTVWASEI